MILEVKWDLKRCEDGDRVGLCPRLDSLLFSTWDEGGLTKRLELTINQWDLLALHIGALGWGSDPELWSEGRKTFVPGPALITTICSKRVFSLLPVPIVLPGRHLILYSLFSCESLLRRKRKTFRERTNREWKDNGCYANVHHSKTLAGR